MCFLVLLLILVHFFFVIILRPPITTSSDPLFPYTTLFRSNFGTDRLNRLRRGRFVRRSGGGLHRRRDTDHRRGLTCIRRNRTDVRIRRGLLIRLCIGVRRGFTVRNLGRGGARFRRERKGGGLLRLRLPAAHGPGRSGERRV